MTATLAHLRAQQNDRRTRAGTARSICTRCGKRGHARNNRAFHPDAVPLAQHRGGRVPYGTLWTRETRLRAQIRGECENCAEPVTNGANRRGDRPGMCEPCRNLWNERRKTIRAAFKVFKAALEDIAAGHNNPIARALAALEAA